MIQDPVILGRTLEAYLMQAGTPIAFHDRATSQTHSLQFSAARDPAGLLPLFIVAGEAVWREATGKGFALDIRPDPDALFGRRLHAVGSGTFSTVMLSVIEATVQATGPKALLLNDLRRHWAERLARTQPGLSTSAGPSP